MSNVKSTFAKNTSSSVCSCPTLDLHAVNHNGSFLAKPFLGKLHKTQHSLQESWNLLVGRPIFVLELTDNLCSLGLYR